MVFLADKCPRLKALHVISFNIQSPAHDVPQGDWPVLPSLTTLDIAHEPRPSDIRCILRELKTPQLRRVGFRGHLSIYGSSTEVRFPGENDGRILLSNMPPTTAIELLSWIANAEDLRVELDLDSIIDGHPGLRNAGTWEPLRHPEHISKLREWWGSVRQDIPKVSWVVPSDEGEGYWKRLGGADLLFDDAIAYLDGRRTAWLRT